VIDVGPGTIVVFSDIACPWAHVSVYRLLVARHRLGLDGDLALDHRAFPLELLNGQATPRSILDAEIPVVGGLEPGAGWQMWQGAPHTWPVTTLPALEAVQAAKEQSLHASEALDRALRIALFADSRCVLVHHVIREVAEDTPGVDAAQVAAALADGRARRHLFEDLEQAKRDAVQGSPHVFLADGTDVHNPGIKKHWHGQPGEGGFPVIEADEPDVYEQLVSAASPTDRARG
jgi:predicted DsbA family dithiol-disulfide isomerase